MAHELGKRTPLGLEDVLLGCDPATVEFVRSLGIDQPESIRRLVLDLPSDGVAIAYVERYISKRKLQIDCGAKRPEIREVE